MRVARAVGLVLAVVLAAGLAACSPAPEEPGLFGRGRSAPTTSESSPAPDGTAANLPVAAEETWVSTDGRSVVVRYAVHAVSRTSGATVLDWSVTVLSAAGVADAGSTISPDTDLGLSGADGLAVTLVDSDHRRVYRPLTRVGRPAQCYCSSLSARDLGLRVDQTRLLQTVYPALPADVRTVDVDIATVPPLWHVPVSAADQVPRTTVPVALDRTIDIHPAVATSATFDQGPGTQQFIAFVEDVVVADTFTALRWTVQSITDGRGLLGAPPLSRAADAPTGGDAGYASGPVLTAGGRRVGARFSVDPTTRRRRCLCSDLAAVSGEEEINQRRTLVTTFPALPRGTQTVDVTLPGLPTLRGIRVVAASDASARTAAATEPAGTRPPGGGSAGAPAVRGWPVTSWPLPSPAVPSPRRWRVQVDRLR